MELDYNSFINGLLNNPSTTNDDRERIVTLLLKERDKGYVTEEKVKEIIDKYLVRVEQVGVPLKNGTSMAIPTNLKYYSPVEMTRFLYEYNSDPILKYTCHEIDDEDVVKSICMECGIESYDFEKHLQLIKEHFDVLRKRHFVDYRMLNLISVYLTGCTIKGEKGKWSSLSIEDNWNCAGIHEWARNNPGLVPNPGKNMANKNKNPGYKISKVFISPLNGQRVKNFSQLILFFKSLFHIKSDNSLHSIIDFVNKEEKYDDLFDIIIDDNNFRNKIELLTNVPTLIQAYKKILKICKEYSDINQLKKPQIELSFYEDENQKCFSIFHRNSIFGKSVNDIVKRLGESHVDLIKNQINGLCDLYIQALFEEGKSYEVNLWDEYERTAREIPGIEGVKYILKYK